jgi:hypothetical protein
MVDVLRLWRRGLHESMAQLGRAGRWENRWDWRLGIVLIVRKAVFIVQVARRDGHQAVLMLTLEWAVRGEVPCGVIRVGVERDGITGRILVMSSCQC